MEVKSIIESGSTKIEVIEKITFDATKLDYYKEIFNSLKESGYLIAEEFDSSIWYIKDEIEANPQIVTFDIEIYTELNIALKGYAVVMRMSGTSKKTIIRNILALKEVIIESVGFLNIEAFELYLRNLSKLRAYTVSIALYSFFDFFPIPELDAYLQILLMIETPESSNRDLPPFIQVFEFDEIINDYTRTESKTSMQKQYFYIVELWWYITNIVPMRPNEFLRIRRNCIDRRNDGTYWLEIPRSKSVSGTLEKEIWYQWIEITLEAFDILSEYIESLNRHIHDSYYLFPIEIHEKNLKVNSTVEKIYGENKFLTTTQLNNWIDRFYQEIVENRYNRLGHKKIRGGDTRHFAIINMFLQGYNMLSISRIAGQSRIESPENYYSHMGSLAEVFTYRLASLRMKEVNVEQQLSSGFFGLRRKAYDIGKKYSNNELVNMQTVEYGKCKDLQFPDNCMEDCRHCPHYIFRPPVNQFQEGIKWLEDSSANITQKIHQQVEMMKIIFGKTTILNGEEVQQELKQASRNLQHFMDQKINIDMQLLENFINSEAENL